MLLFIYKQRYRAHQLALQALQETYQRELLQSQLEIQNQTLLQIAEELHDHIGQLLTVAVMRLNTLEDEVREPDIQHAVQQTREVVSTIITDVRTLAKTLDHNTVQQFGLLPSLKLELERIQRIGRVQTQLTTTGEPYSLGEQAETVLLRMAQESLNNALKHAQAHTLTVDLYYKPDNFTMTITDDGRGFEIEEVTNRNLDQAGSGVSNLYRRAKLLGGSCTIKSWKDKGTDVQIELPR
ncbi:sensor histidine kinase [Spirosoma soli]|uniref:histidine kinase n=1 Tax=Spirosoma soli TaxID=1770529 RepID=A0ABW5M0S4_9BACT